MAAQKLNVHIEVNKGDHLYQFSMPVGAPLGEAYDAAFSVLQEILKLAQQAVEKMKQNDSGEVVLSQPLESN